MNLNNEEVADLLGRRVWEAIDPVVKIEECDFYSFIPDAEVAPDAEEGNLWSFYYFFFNKRLKRMVFFTCRCVNAMAPTQPEERLDNREYTPSFEDDGMSFEQYTMHNIEV